MRRGDKEKWRRGEFHILNPPRLLVCTLKWLYICESHPFAAFVLYHMHAKTAT
jgi:hypothetical protein